MALPQWSQKIFQQPILNVFQHQFSLTSNQGDNQRQLIGALERLHDENWDPLPNIFEVADGNSDTQTNGNDRTW